MGMRRLHDIGRKGWLYIIWILFTYGFMFIYGFMFKDEPDFYFNIPEGETAGIWELFSVEFIIYAALSFLQFILMIVLIILLSRDSQSGQNQYGPNPKGIGNLDVFN